MNNLPPSFQNPEMTNISDLVGKYNRCFYIPSYQRDFSWVLENRRRFLEDVQEGFSLLADSKGGEDDDALIFLGSMISYQDRLHSIKPKGDDIWHLPSKDLCGVVDGQQRLTMLMLLSAALHDYIRIRKECGVDWLRLKADEMLDNTSAIFQITKTIGGRAHYFPRMIRQDCDVWSYRDGHAVYKSPLSYYLDAYGRFSRAVEYNNTPCRGKIKPLACPGDGETEKRHKYFVGIADAVCKGVGDICNEWKDIPDVRNIIRNAKVMRNLLLHDELPANGADDLKTEEQLKLARAVVFAGYILHRVYFVTMETTVEGFAFDIFESLNTTGQELTAYETFKPEVVKFEKSCGGYNDSPSAKNIGIIDNLLGGIGNQSRESLTSEILIAFALSETGVKLGRKIRLQGAYMRRQYKGLPGKDEKRDFVQMLRQSAEWVLTKGGWTMLGTDKAHRDDKELQEEREQAAFCMDFIRDSTHKISHGVLMRFYDAAQNAAPEDKRQKRLDLYRAIKAVAAFFVLFRGIGGRSSEVEGCHRQIMQTFRRRKVADKDGVERGGEKADLQKLQTALYAYLAEKGKIKNAGEWAQKSMEVPLYREDAKVAKFLVMAASHNTDMDSDNPGCIKPVNPGVHPAIICADSWKKDAHATVEHIVPQQQAEVLGNKMHCLGNLTLLPKRANSILGKRKWQERQAIYFALSAKDESENAAARKQIAFLDKDKDEKNAGDFLLKETRYLPMTRTLAFCDKFGEGEIKERHRNLAGLAWKTLAQQWLGFKE